MVRLGALMLLGAIGQAAAHMELSWPFPFQSRFDPANSDGNIDYSMTAPLSSDGSNWPCKGYHAALDTTPIKAVLKANANFNVSIGGSATHAGGSCEFSVSYDGGKNFAVIHRVVGGCPLSSEYGVPVSIENSKSVKSYTGPSLFRGNSLADGSCVTEEGIEIQFPNVESVPTDFDGDVSSSTPPTELANCSLKQSAMITVNSNGGAEDGGDPPTPSDSAPSYTGPSSKFSSSKLLSSSQANTKISETPTQITEPPATAPAASSTSSAIASKSLRPPQVGGQRPKSKGCISGKFLCAKNGMAWSMCSNGIWVDMGPVADGMKCQSGQMVRAEQRQKRTQRKRHPAFSPRRLS